MLARGQAAPQSSDEVPRITAPNLYHLMKEGRAYVIDVRANKAFVVCHIPGAHNMTLRDITPDSVKTLPHDKLIVFYCA